MLPSESQIALRGLNAKLYTVTALAELDNAKKDDAPQTEAQAAQLLVDAGLVTRYQAKMLMRGKVQALYFGPYKVLSLLKQNEQCRYFGVDDREADAKRILCVLRSDATDEMITSNFPKAVRNQLVPDLPPGEIEKFVTVDKLQVAVLIPPAKRQSSPSIQSSSTSTDAHSLPTIDDLPALPSDDAPLPGLVGDEEPPPMDVSDLLSEQSVTQESMVDPDEPIVAEPELGTVKTEGFAVKAPRRRKKSNKSWRPGPRVIVGGFGVVVAVVLYIVLMQALEIW